MYARKLIKCCSRKCQSHKGSSNPGPIKDQDTIDRGGSTSKLNKTPCPCGSCETPGEACWTSLQLNHSTPGGRTARGARVRFVSRFPHHTLHAQHHTLHTHHPPTASDG